MVRITQSTARGLLGLALFPFLILGPGLPGAGLEAQETMADRNRPERVAALGRLEPRGGIVRVAAPSTPLSLAGSVVSRLLVAEGEDVRAGQLLAVTDAESALEAAVAVAEAELRLQERAAEASLSRAEEACVIANVLAREAERRDSLLERELASREETEQSRGDAEAQAASCTAARVSARVAEAGVQVAIAQLALREAERDRSRVEAPFDGRVLRVLAEAGEYVGPDGVLELGRVQEMMAIAEVFETEVRYLAPGQPATVTSDALDGPKRGRVVFIRPKVQKQDEIGTDPAARKDARIIEVGVALDEPREAMGLTNLQVEVVIEP
jgi:HlyD family secretion protein